MTEKIRCGAHYCEICKKCLKLPRLRKNFTKDYFYICEDCEIKDDFRRAFHKMNKILTDEERESINEFHRKLWEYGDRLRDLTRSNDLANIYKGLGSKLMEVLEKMPWLEK